jgi:acetyltransferase-like isoleucine patch superfamily enzyme
MIQFFKNIFTDAKEYLRNQYQRAKLQRQYPTCHIYPGATIDSNSRLGKYDVIFQNTKITNSTINDHTFIQKNSRVFNADIGKFCSIASRVSVGLGRHPTNMVCSHPAFYSNIQPIAKSFCKSNEYTPFDRIKIGNDVWIGENAMIMDGVKIGHGAVIGMAAVITRNIPDYAIVSGNPARIFTYRFDEEIIGKLLKIKWWDMPDEWFESHYELFRNPLELIKFMQNTGSK